MQVHEGQVYSIYTEISAGDDADMESRTVSEVTPDHGDRHIVHCPHRTQGLIS